jgi:transposase
MRHKSERHQGAAERAIKDIRRRTRKRYSSEEKIRIGREARDLKEVVAEQALELRLLKKSMIGDGEDIE